MGVSNVNQSTHGALQNQASRRAAANRLLERLRRGDGAHVHVEPLLRLMRCAPDHTENVIAAIEGCPTLTGRLLSVINSAAFGLPRSIESVRRAVLQLGPARARGLALAFAMRVLNDEWKLPPAMSQHLWVNSLRKAYAAKLACEAIEPDRADDAFCAALIQDVGLPALIDADHTFYEMTIGLGRRTWCEQELDHFGMDHAAAGAELLRAWGAPEAICETVRNHHRPPIDDGPDSAAMRMSLYVSALIPHFGEHPSAHEREWLTALFGQLLAPFYASPDAFLAAANAAAKLVHGNARPAAVDANIVRQLAQIVCDDTASLVSNLCHLEHSLGQVQKQTQSLRFAACTDPLTGVLNRRGFNELGVDRIRIAAEQHKPALFLAIDVDNFKLVNDSHGHDAGDRLLRKLAKLLRDNLDREDLIGRTGGDEFVALAVDVDEPRARAIVDRLHTRCNGAAYQLDDHHTVTLNFTLGALFCPRLPSDADLQVLLQAADDVMYSRKRNGKAGFVFVNYPADADRQPRPAA